MIKKLSVVYVRKIHGVLRFDDLDSNDTHFLVLGSPQCPVWPEGLIEGVKAELYWGQVGSYTGWVFSKIV